MYKHLYASSNAPSKVEIRFRRKISLSLSLSEMSESLRIRPAVRPIHQPKTTSHSPHILPLFPRFPNSPINIASLRRITNHVKALKSRSQEVGGIGSLPLSLNLEPVSSETQFDLILAEAQPLGEPVVVLWMASWCRKCIYLKPKLEKLAAEYYRRVRFYCVDVNAVSHKLVVRAEVTKMPTIQLWKDGKKQAEVIGGHKAYLVVNEVRNMIENESAI